MAQARRLVPILLALAMTIALAGVGQARPVATLTSCPPSTSPGTTTDVYSCRWNLEQIKAPPAWTRSTGRGAVVAVIDTGVDLPHPELPASRVAGMSCVGTGGDPKKCTPDPTPTDATGHGTAISGVVAATSNPTISFSGVAPDAFLEVVKVLDPATGAIDPQDLAAGINWAADQGIKIITVALGDPQFKETIVSSKVPGNPVAAAFGHASASGAMAVVPAARPADLGLADFGAVHGLVVGSTDSAGRVATAPNPAARQTIVAPGGTAADPQDGIAVAWRQSSYDYRFGVSLAAAHVSGGLALLRARGLSPDDAVARLLATAANKGICGTNCGELDVAAALGIAPTPATPPAGGGGTGSAARPPATDNNLPGGYTIGAAPTTVPSGDGVTNAGDATAAGPGRLGNGAIPGGNRSSPLRLQHRGSGSDGPRVAALIGLTVAALLGVGFAVRGLTRNAAGRKDDTEQLDTL